MQHPRFLNGIYSRIKTLKPPYPGLRHRIEGDKEVWEGPLSFTARFDSVRVKDIFSVRIILPTEPEGFPLVIETGGRTDEIIAFGKAKKLADLHVNINRTVCLCPKPDEKRRFPGVVNLTKFINELVIPYFFALHQFEKTGKWIWGQYNHGKAGIVEYYVEHKHDNDSELLKDCVATLGYRPRDFLNIQFNGKESCFCGTNARMKKCHPELIAAFREMISDAKNQHVA